MINNHDNFVYFVLVREKDFVVVTWLHFTIVTSSLLILQIFISQKTAPNDSERSITQADKKRLKMINLPKGMEKAVYTIDH